MIQRRTLTTRTNRDTTDNLYPRRGACSDCGTPTVARPPRTSALYERETGIDRTGACACPLLCSPPLLLPPLIRFLVLLRRSSSSRFSLFSQSFLGFLIRHDRPRARLRPRPAPRPRPRPRPTDWINRNPGDAGDRWLPFRKMTRNAGYGLPPASRTRPRRTRIAVSGPRQADTTRPGYRIMPGYQKPDPPADADT